RISTSLRWSARRRKPLRSSAPRTIDSRKRKREPMPTPAQVLQAPEKGRFPGVSPDIVSFGFVRDVKVDGATVSFPIHFSTENPNVGQQLSRDSEAAVRALDGVGNVRVNLEIAPRQSAGPAQGGGQAGILEGVRYKIAV